MSITRFDILVDEQIDLIQELQWVSGEMSFSKPTETDRLRAIEIENRLEEIEAEIEQIRKDS